MKHSTPIVRFHLLYEFKFPGRRRLKEKIIALFKNEHKILGTIDYIFCSDERLLSINQEYLKHDTFTDIITFDLSENQNIIIGEVYISIERIKENALFFHVLFQEELTRVVLHGALHLCGYKDKGMENKQIMRQKEDFYLKD